MSELVKGYSSSLLVSVIIPTLNEEQYIENALRLLRKQSYHNFEMVVADGGSIDNTVNKASGYAKVVISDRPGVSRQINLGFTHTRGKIIIFPGADVIPPSDWLAKIVREFQRDKEVIAVTGPVQVPANSPFWLKIEYHFWNVIRFIYSLLPRPFGFFFSTEATTGVRRCAFEKIRGYDEALHVNEDADLGQKLMRIGKVRFCWGLKLCVIPRRAKSIFGFNAYYLYILGNMFPFSLLPDRIWKALRLRSSIKFVLSHVKKHSAH